jgi:FkbM family methyltransferase
MNKALIELTWNFLYRSNLGYKLLPQGVNIYFDLRRKLPKEKFKIVFDVGANIGQTTSRMIRVFPIAEIYCFEPIKSTYYKLKRNTEGESRVHNYQVALGSTVKSQLVILQESSLLNSLKHELNSVNQGDLNQEKVENIKIDTIDNFCVKNNIKHIDFLKIDAEGFDLEVLKGAQKLIDSGGVEFIQVETGISYTNNEHIPLQQFRQHLEKRGYVLFGIYDQTLEWTGELRLMFCNAVFRLESPGKNFLEPIPESISCSLL